MIVFLHDEGRLSPADIARWMERDDRIEQMGYANRVKRVLAKHYSERDSKAV